MLARRGTSPSASRAAGVRARSAEQEKLSKGVDEDDLEAVLAVSPVRLVLDQDQEEAADLTATQTPVPTPSPLRRWAVLEHVPVNELDCLRVLRGDRSGLDSNDLMGADEPTREELEDPMLKRFHEERRRLGASFEAIRGIIVHRENALFRELVEDRDELECAKAELRKQILAALANNQDPDSSENRNRRKFKRNPLQEVSPFVCGTTPATASTNQQIGVKPHEMRTFFVREQLVKRILLHVHVALV
ncbi:Hypothetical Protein FCC1311_039192 [Hondaea fermentalgiana]|uniref:Uncharacterized protein n=1 Tax=Hondaea fermentalgiana TaxID=2315210 RepID=A0A2R5G9J0_9STRA|nr:Hypothetical Protein FCC1311_039192 [Hondaea fermentalgiana]|eukprot:GBG27696.1 Hypothetical Protein FCC1311_039192 [Hondaea fermentalgiana]